MSAVGALKTSNALAAYFLRIYIQAIPVFMKAC